MRVDNQQVLSPVVCCGVIAKGDSLRSFIGSCSLRLLKSSRPLPAIKRTSGCYILEKFHDKCRNCSQACLITTCIQTVFSGQTELYVFEVCETMSPHIKVYVVTNLSAKQPARQTADVKQPKYGPVVAYAMISCFSFLRPSATSSGIFSVLATMLGGVSASHCVNEMSTTRSLL